MLKDLGFNEKAFPSLEWQDCEETTASSGVTFDWCRLCREYIARSDVTNDQTPQ
ncbi:hypothetical protein J6590_060404 [Homalodisca vitripennis]|nr:hypothetical protein J6590_060404 [Homalodisca vitripennis]